MLICKYCGREISRQSTLTVHERTCKNNPNNINKKICKNCGKEFISPKDICNKCIRKLEKENAVFISSQEELDNNKDKLNWIKFNCTICGKEDTKQIRSKNINYKLYCHSCMSSYTQSNFSEDKKCEINESRKKTAEERYGSVENYYKHIFSKTKQSMQEKYGVDSVFNIPSVKESIKNTILERYGVTSPMQSEEIKEKFKKTMLENYGVSGTLASEELRDKVRQTCEERYGKDYMSNFILRKAMETKKLRYGDENYNNMTKHQQTCLEKYGVPSYSQTVDFQYKRYKKYLYDGEYFDSSWELALWIYAKDNNLGISRVQDPFVYYYNNIEYMYYPDFKYNGSLIEIKGTQFFENGDVNGKMINPFDRSLDDKFEAKHQCALDNNVIFFTENDIKPILQYVNNKYTKDYIDLFLVDLPFPYLNSDLSDTSDMGLIHHFHKSIYIASRNGKISPLDAWEDKNIIKKVALNRLKYKGHCRPSDILQGFNVTRIANKATVFKPKLAEELIKKYLNDCDSIFDPFSGFSGRMLGTIRCGKDYFGQDINEDHVRESNEILRYLNMQGSNFVVIQDILKSKGYDFGDNTCLFTCPPYGGKEHWNKNRNEIEKSCDEWIDLCLEKYKCKKYLFVVDETEKYKDKIVETLTNKSHFGSNNEYVILISHI